MISNEKTNLLRSWEIIGRFGLVCIFVSLIAIAGSATVFAQSEPLEQVQILNGGIDGADDLDQYRMENLRQGDSVFVHVQGLSGNLDPFIEASLKSGL